MSIKSWHDSDEIDSDLECEAYNMLYYSIEQKNLTPYYDRNLIEFSSLSKTRQGEIENNTVVISDLEDNESQNSEQGKPVFKLENTHGLGDWSVDIIDIQPKKNSSSRYFEANLNAVCTVCLKKGHEQSECTRKGPVCIFCGKDGHVSNDCTELICHVCFQTSHVTKKCPQYFNFIREICHRCGQHGHHDQICPDLWRQYKYTIVPGRPIMKPFSSQNSVDVFCANCSRSGHFTDQCSRKRMTSGFLGPAPIMEIVRFDVVDIYKSYNFSYRDSNLKPFSGADSTICSKSLSSSENNCSEFGHGCIMLNSTVKTKENQSKKLSYDQLTKPLNSLRSSTPVRINGQLIDSTMPSLPESLLKKLFPEETRSYNKIPTALRITLRKKLKTFLKNGYLPGDSQITQDRMEFWLQEISTGRSLTYKEKRKLLCSVSAALHSISDRVSDVTTDLIPNAFALSNNDKTTASVGRLVEKKIIEKKTCQIAPKVHQRDCEEDDFVMDMANYEPSYLPRKRNTERKNKGGKKGKTTTQSMEVCKKMGNKKQLSATKRAVSNNKKKN